MLISLTAVIEDGSPRRPGVVSDPRRTLSIPQGSDVTLRVSVITSGGSPVDLSDPGTELLLTVKKNPKLLHDSWPRISKKASIEAGYAIFQIEPGDTYGWAAGMYAWDVWLTKDGSRDAVIPTSPLTLLQSVAPVPVRPPPPTLELVANDTEPLILDFSGTDITGWLIEVHIGYDTPFVRSAVITDPTHGIAEIPWVVGDLVAGIWGGEVRITKPGPVSQTSEEYIFDIRQPIIGSAGVNFAYYDATVPGTYDASFITGLANQPLVASRQFVFTVNAGTGQYIYVALPTAYGTPTFTVDGFPGGFSLAASAVLVTNLAGMQAYDLWKSNNVNLGNTTVQVS